MAEYAELVNALRCCAKLNSLSLFKRDLMKQAAETIERLSAEMCPHYIRNIHDRGDDSLCKKAGCEVKDVQPVVHGHWVMEEYDYPCSVCGETVAYEYDVRILKYCPNCGARMDGVDDG